jgi:hypothetical protein
MWHRAPLGSSPAAALSLGALGGDRFLVPERNNRGIGVGATLGSPDKRVYEIDLAGASDVSARCSSRAAEWRRRGSRG